MTLSTPKIDIIQPTVCRTSQDCATVVANPSREGNIFHFFRCCFRHTLILTIRTHWFGCEGRGSCVNIDLEIVTQIQAFVGDQFALAQGSRECHELSADIFSELSE